MFERLYVCANVHISTFVHIRVYVGSGNCTSVYVCGVYIHVSSKGNQTTFDTCTRGEGTADKISLQYHLYTLAVCHSTLHCPCSAVSERPLVQSRCHT